MVIEHVELTAAAGQEGALETALVEIRQRLHMSAGFRGVSVLQGIERPGTYLVRVLWETPEELLAFAESRFEQCWAPAQPYLAGPLRVEHFQERESLGLTGPGVVTDLTWVEG